MRDPRVALYFLKKPSTTPCFLGANKTPNKTPNKNKPTKPVENDNSVNNGSISYASVAAATQPPPPPTETTAPQLMSPMVFAGQDHQSSPGPQGGLPQGGPPHGGPPGLPTVLHPKPVPTLPNPMQTIPPPVMPLNGVPFHLPVPAPQVTPLTEAQLMQVCKYLFYMVFLGILTYIDTFLVLCN